MHEIARRFISRNWSIPAAAFTIEVQPLSGGLESTVARITVRARRTSGLPSQLVVKDLRHRAAREADVYDTLWTGAESPPTVKAFGREVVGPRTYLFLEHVHSSAAWPWRTEALSIEVCRALARVHDLSPKRVESFRWDYDGSLYTAGASTLRLARHVRLDDGARAWRRLGDLARVVNALPVLRAELCAAGTTVLHGDVHPGNVLVRPGPVQQAIALVDWGRARLGSPLEDVACWLQSLGCWEPTARRRHDTFLCAYLGSRSAPVRLTPALRRSYWLASASNGLSGAIAYHLSILGDCASSRDGKLNAWLALQSWQRVMRRAAALLGPSPRC